MPATPPSHGWPRAFPDSGAQAIPVTALLAASLPKEGGQAAPDQLGVPGRAGGASSCTSSAQRPEGPSHAETPAAATAPRACA